jgi:hypothetical protein
MPSRLFSPWCCYKNPSWTKYFQNAPETTKFSMKHFDWVCSRADKFIRELALSEMRRRPARRFLGEMTTPRRPGESLLQFLVGIFSQNFTSRFSIIRLLKYERTPAPRVSTDNNNSFNVRILLARNRRKCFGKNAEREQKTLIVLSVFSRNIFDGRRSAKSEHLYADP